MSQPFPPRRRRRTYTDEELEAALKAHTMRFRTPRTETEGEPGAEDAGCSYTPEPNPMDAPRPRKGSPESIKAALQRAERTSKRRARADLCRP